MQPDYYKKIEEGGKEPTLRFITKLSDFYNIPMIKFGFRYQEWKKEVSPLKKPGRLFANYQNVYPINKDLWR